MKLNKYLFGALLLTGIPTFGASSPYKGAPVAEGSYYLYQVESGQWLQSNRNTDAWTTHAELGGIGFDVELRKLDGFNDGFQIFCFYTNNGELNGSDQDRFYLDQGDRQLTEWIFIPVEGAENQYKIMVKARAADARDRDRIVNDTYMGYDPAGAFGGLSDKPADFTWQLVTRDERIEKMVAQAKAGQPADATFLLPWNERDRNNLRDRSWDIKDIAGDGGGFGLDGSHRYPVFERWHRIDHSATYTITDLPNGTYSFAVQGYYRDGDIEYADVRKRAYKGESFQRAKYYAGASSELVKTIFDDARNDGGRGFNKEVKLLKEDGSEDISLYVPNSMNDASEVFWYEGNDVMNPDMPYMNNWISTGVSDGKLTVGVSKEGSGEDCFHDWFVYKRMYLRYDSEEVKEDDLTGLKNELSSLIDEAKALPSAPKFVKAISDAEASLDESVNTTELLQAKSNLKNWVNVINSVKNDIIAFNETLQYVSDEDSAEAQKMFAEAENSDNFLDAIKTLRYARRRAAADKQEDVYEGAQPEANKNYYIYNVGQKQFLSGGSDWGAHAALSMPGTEITLEELNKKEGDFAIETGLYNGDNKHYLGYRGYMDSPFEGGEWKFIPVEGKENVFHIVQGDYPDVHVAWNPYASVDAGNSDETTVGTECRNLDPNDLNAQWKLVTREEREALLAAASLNNPVDATFFIKSPNFSQRENSREHWKMDNVSIWGEGGNHYDFTFESWNTDNCHIYQTVEGLPEGIYTVEVNGYYRNGDGNNHFNYEDLQNAVLYAGDSNLETYVEIPLHNINKENLKAPGEGDIFNNGAICVPNNCDQATNFFKSGLYKNSLQVTVVNPNRQDLQTRASDDENVLTGDLPIGVRKDVKGEEHDWVVADNFRLKYYGPKDQPVNVNEIETPAAYSDGKTYNLQGIEVKNTLVPGIYIRNGKKFVVK